MRIFDLNSDLHQAIVRGRRNGEGKAKAKAKAKGRKRRGKINIFSNLDEIISS